jgi:hypothetical protein
MAQGAVPDSSSMTIFATLAVMLAVMCLYVMRRRVRLGKRKPTF